MCVFICMCSCVRESLFCVYVCFFCVSQDLDVEDGVEEEVVAGVVGIATRVHVGPQQNAKDTYRNWQTSVPWYLYIELREESIGCF
jgi:hypothetical protein